MVTAVTHEHNGRWIGVCEFVPCIFTSRAGELMEGFKIDVCSRIAHEMGVKSDFKVYSLESGFDALNKGNRPLGGLRLHRAGLCESLWSLESYRSKSK